MTKEPMKPYGKLSKGKMKIQHIANLNVDFKYIIPNVKTVGIGPQDVYDGNQRLILGLIWSVICHFTLIEFQEMAAQAGPGGRRASMVGSGSKVDLTAFKKHLMEWAGDCLERLPAPQPECKGLKDTFADGKAFLGILHAVAPEKQCVLVFFCFVPPPHSRRAPAAVPSPRRALCARATTTTRAHTHATPPPRSVGLSRRCEDRRPVERTALTTLPSSDLRVSHGGGGDLVRSITTTSYRRCARSSLGVAAQRV
jgi:hypothetical protein